MAAALSYAQLRASLFARTGGRVHAVLDGRVLPGLPARFAEARTVGWDCLQRGALGPEAARMAAYIVELDPASDFTDWLLSEAPSVHPGWGLVWVSTRPLLAMREHCRSLGDVLMPDGSRRPWRWYDPELLDALLPELSPSQHDELFGGAQIVLVGPRAWTWLGLEQGVLARDERPLMAAAK
ncbi:MAG: DUF4123 domain-containing protein [Piscinibacter sp.]|nr:DUF4123 domain-containing protein [Piscinibacter sp.]